MDAPDDALHLPQATRLIAIRHGETAWNVDTRLQGQLDIPLNPRGQEQARRLGLSLRQETLDRLISSDLSRAHATAEAIGQACGLPVATDAGLRERHFGDWQGHTYAELSEKFPALAERWRRREPDFSPPGGESLRVFYDRVVSTVTRLAHAHAGQTLVLVAHGGVLDCLYRAASRMSLDMPRTWELPNTGVNRLLHTHSGLTLVGWGDVQHLDDAARDESADRVGHAA